MSQEARILLGYEEEEDGSKKRERENKKKRGLLLQAEGTRKAGASFLSSLPVLAHRAVHVRVLIASSTVQLRPLALSLLHEEARSPPPTLPFLRTRVERTSATRGSLLSGTV